LPCLRLKDADKRVQEARVAGPAPPQDGQHPACRDRQIQAPEDLVAVEGLVELMKINGTGHHASISSHQKNFVRKKSEIRIRMAEVTTVAVVARPIPSVPPETSRPLLQPTIPMRNPKTTLL